MARPLSEAKHEAILAAAASTIASEGLAATTSRIAKVAGISEGSLFTYFATKDALLNALYLSVKQEIADLMMADYPGASSMAERARAVWCGYVRWGVRHPEKRRAMAQLSVSNRITEETRAASMKPLVEIDHLLAECVEGGAGHTVAFAAAIMTSLAETTMVFMAAEPHSADRYATDGFDAFWRAIGKA